MANGGLKVPVSREAEPSSETRYHGPSVVLTAGKENENTVRCSLTEGVAKRARDDQGGKTWAYVRREFQCTHAKWQRHTLALRRVSADFGAPKNGCARLARVVKIGAVSSVRSTFVKKNDRSPLNWSQQPSENWHT